VPAQTGTGAAAPGLAGPDTKAGYSLLAKSPCSRDCRKDGDDSRWKGCVLTKGSYEEGNGTVENEVREELGWDRVLDDSGILVKADGVVTLTGTVPTFNESVLAAGDASRVGGVTQVHNELLVDLVGEAVDDSVIAEHCVAALDKARLGSPRCGRRDRP
jgi:BON domain